MHLLGNPFDYLIAFGAGVLVSFSPCVYPLLPVVIGVIGARSAKRAGGFFLSLVYVSGIAVTYSVLGLVASLTGIFFGRITTHPATQILVGLIFVIFGILMLLDLFNYSFSGPKISNKNKGYFSVFLLGLSSGFIVSPCITPVLSSVLAYISTKKNIFYGVSLLMVFAYGMGLLLIIAGTFSNILTNLPQSGRWMVYAKKVSAVLLILAGGYFIYSGIANFI
jgi:thiol:disulfide interchange protein DsbD